MARTLQPANDADSPRYSTDEREYSTLSRAGVVAFFQTARGDRFQAPFWMAILTGPGPAKLRTFK